MVCPTPRWRAALRMVQVVVGQERHLSNRVQRGTQGKQAEGQTEPSADGGLGSGHSATYTTV
jgi:hypothetical protein